MGSSSSQMLIPFLFLQQKKVGFPQVSLCRVAFHSACIACRSKLSSSSANLLTAKRLSFYVKMALQKSHEIC